MPIRSAAVRQPISGAGFDRATMMLKFALRNGDVLRLRDENFVEKDSRHYLNYTPHKTELSSGRRVFCAKGVGIGMPPR